MLKYAGSCAAALVLSPPLFPYIHTPHTDRRALFSLPSSAAPLLARAPDVDVQPKQLLVSSRASAQAARGGPDYFWWMDGWTEASCPSPPHCGAYACFEWQLRNSKPAPRTVREYHHSPVARARCERDVSRWPVDIKHCSPQWRLALTVVLTYVLLFDHWW